MSAPPSPYVVWCTRDAGNSCMLLPPEGIERDWEIRRGVRRERGFPADALLRMSRDHKRAIGMPDSLMNLSRHVVVHERVRAFLAPFALKNVEYLPVAIVNHKGRVASADYFILHPVVAQDCLDTARSGVRYNHIIPTDVSGIDQLVLDPGRIDPELRIFRIAGFGVPIVVERTLSAAIAGAGLTGITFTELDGYGQ